MQSQKLSEKPMKVNTKTVSTKYAQYMKSFTESLVAQNSLSKQEAQAVMT
jgi:hypothetical protein